MSEPLHKSPDRPEAAIGEALRQLPLLQPERDLWASLARELAPPQKRRPRWPYWLSAAAAVLLTVLLWPGRTLPTTPTEPDALHAWIAHSQQLEGTLRQLESRPTDAETALAGAELEDLIGLTDLQLSVAEKPEDELALWKQRVLLMNELTELRRSGRSTAANESVGMMPASYRIN
ncbi:hypothetical protein C7S18_12000 [Ahniella affigens]|uniref:Uncharacterized protein n=1 Tax=Ahniella affigens TaxID=2021234 RepID=A0A2P1PSR3_9GAMM|nr:hypothetical protein [Ahniella affigens]AVP97874.1 hypothetical protein C7S18_12000 [Ahniella affigens]